ncbi:MAG: hypothetical protein WA173_17630 [Pseudomonas sp.]|uniref:hypothetical protein n=1 Tax=Pseudomonas sp. TaxID=306 RepID=UPI003BB7BCA6
MKPVNGIDAVRDIVSGNWVKHSDVFAVKLYPTLNKTGEFSFKLALTMVHNFPETNKDGITIHCVNPKITQWPVNNQIIGLTIDYIDACGESGWEHGFWKISDFEFGAVEIQCSDLYVTREPPEALNTMIEA